MHYTEYHQASDIRVFQLKLKMVKKNTGTVPSVGTVPLKIKLKNGLIVSVVVILQKSPNYYGT